VLDNNTRLQTKCELLYGGFKMNIIISEEKDLLWPQKPLLIDPKQVSTNSVKITYINLMFSGLLSIMYSL
jgi:hypothetical protein